MIKRFVCGFEDDADEDEETLFLAFSMWILSSERLEVFEAVIGEERGDNLAAVFCFSGTFFNFESSDWVDVEDCRTSGGKNRLLLLRVFVSSLKSELGTSSEFKERFKFDFLLLLLSFSALEGILDESLLSKDEAGLLSLLKLLCVVAFISFAVSVAFCVAATFSVAVTFAATRLGLELFSRLCIEFCVVEAAAARNLEALVVLINEELSELELELLGSFRDNFLLVDVAAVLFVGAFLGVFVVKEANCAAICFRLSSL